MSLKPGIHQISMQEYLSLKALSSGLCNTLLQCSPAHAKCEQDNRQDDATEASDTGTAIHDGLLEGMDRIQPIDALDWRTKIAKELRDQARAEGKIPMLAIKVEAVRKAVEAAKAFVAGSEIAGVFDSGKAEQTIIWQENEALFCKMRADWLTDDHSLMLHVKTTQGSAQPESFIRNQLVPMGYDVAAMFYERGAGLTLASAPPRSVFLVIEQAPPFGCSLVGLSPAMQELASAKVERAIRTWAQCSASGKWPGYPSRIAYAEPTNWQMAEHESSMLTDQELSEGIPA